MIYSLLLQVVRFLNATEDEWEVSRCEIEVGAKVGEGSYRAVFKGQLIVTAMTPMIHAHKKEMDFKGKSHLSVAVTKLPITKISSRQHSVLGMPIAFWNRAEAAMSNGRESGKVVESMVSTDGNILVVH